MSFLKYKNNFNLTPRTHISLDSKKPDILDKENKTKKLDKVDRGLKRLIYLGKIIRHYFPHKGNLLRNRGLFDIKNSNKMTPFQVYQKNKELTFLKLKNRRNLKIQLKTVNSEKRFKRFNAISDINSTKKINSIDVNSKNKYHNSVGCSFKNKLIKSVFEKNKNKSNSKINLQHKVFNYTESNFNIFKKNIIKKDINDLIKLRYILSSENSYNDRPKNIIDNLLYEKDKMMLLNRQKLLKKKNIINLFNEIKIRQNKFNTETLSYEDNKNFYNNIPLIEFTNLHLINNNFGGLFIKNTMKSSIFKRQKRQIN